MLKEAMFFGCGIVVGVAVCYTGYRLYKYYTEKGSVTEDDVFEKKLGKNELQAKRFNELISNQTYVEFLTAKELTAWFKDNRSSVPENAKMIILIPTEEHMKGLGYLGENELDENTNIIQVFYNENSGDVYKIRLVSYTDIESNLQANLIEQDGMIVVTD